MLLLTDVLAKVLWIFSYLLLLVQVTNHQECDSRLSSRGTIVSEGYPNEYPSHFDCEWIIEAGSNDIVTLTFDDFGIEPGADCEYDWLEISSRAGSQKYCGDDMEDLGVDDGVLRYLGETKLHMRSDDSVQLRGISLSYSVQQRTTTARPSRRTTPAPTPPPTTAPPPPVFETCDDDPCENGGECVDDIDGFYCFCEDGFEGDRCEINVDECASNPCENGATCVDGSNAWSCECVDGYVGETCAVEVDECRENPCLNGATCEDLVNAFNCICTAGWTGYDCGTEIDECDPNPCKNYGYCEDELNGFSCICHPDWSGPTCEISLITTTVPPPTTPAPTLPPTEAPTKAPTQAPTKPPTPATTKPPVAEEPPISEPDPEPDEEESPISEPDDDTADEEVVDDPAETDDLDQASKSKTDDSDTSEEDTEPVDSNKKDVSEGLTSTVAPSGNQTVYDVDGNPIDGITNTTTNSTPLDGDEREEEEEEKEGDVIPVVIATASVASVALAAAAHYAKIWLASKAKIGIAGISTPGIQTTAAADGGIHSPGRDDDNQQQQPTTTPAVANVNETSSLRQRTPRVETEAKDSRTRGIFNNMMTSLSALNMPTNMFSFSKGSAAAPKPTAGQQIPPSQQTATAAFQQPPAAQANPTVYQQPGITATSAYRTFQGANQMPSNPLPPIQSRSVTFGADAFMQQQIRQETPPPAYSVAAPTVQPATTAAAAGTAFTFSANTPSAPAAEDGQQQAANEKRKRRIAKSSRGARKKIHPGADPTAPLPPTAEAPEVTSSQISGPPQQQPEAAMDRTADTSMSQTSFADAQGPAKFTFGQVNFSGLSAQPSFVIDNPNISFKQQKSSVQFAPPFFQTVSTAGGPRSSTPIKTPTSSLQFSFSQSSQSPVPSSTDQQFMQPPDQMTPSADDLFESRRSSAATAGNLSAQMTSIRPPKKLAPLVRPPPGGLPPLQGQTSQIPKSQTNPP